MQGIWNFYWFYQKNPEEYGERFVSNNVEVKVYTSSKKDNFQKGVAETIYLSTKWLYRTLLLLR